MVQSGSNDSLVIPALRMLREDFMFQATLGYTARFCLKTKQSRKGGYYAIRPYVYYFIKLFGIQTLFTV